MGGNDLKKAERLYRAKKYSKLLQLLEPQVFRYRESFRFFFLLGMSCLRTGDFGGAYSYLQRALSIKPSDVHSLLGLAAIHLRRQETSEALRIWFQVLDEEPGNRQAKRGLKLLRKNVDADKLKDLTESSKINSLIPVERNYLPLFLSSTVLALVLAAFLLYPLIDDIVSERFIEKRPEIRDLELRIEEGYRSDEIISADIEMNEKEIEKTYKRIVELFHDYRDNRAQREINRLLMSNASKEVKAKLRLLEGHIREPSFSTIRGDFGYREVSENPELYENCYVSWRGRVSNLRVDEDAIRFEFLVGYETEKVVEGIVPVRVPFAIDIDPAYPIEVLGQVQLRSSGIRLEAISLHQFSQGSTEGEE